MSRDLIIGKVVDGNLTEKNETLLPLYFKRRTNVSSWLQLRAADCSRPNIILLKRMMGISDYDDVSTVLKVHGAVITDTYWFKAENENITYDEIKFKDNRYCQLALIGNTDNLELGYQKTPELTNIGSYEKCWRIVDDQWWLYKRENDMERFSELFIYYFGKALGLNMASYQLDGLYIRSLDFTNSATLNFESAYSLVGDNEDYQTNFKVFNNLSADLSKAYLGMLYMDTLCLNMDRHTQNYGVLRDPMTGKIISFSPLFDHNIALLSRGYPQVSRKNDLIIKLFTNLISDNPIARKQFEELKCPAINKETICNCLKMIPLPVNNQFMVNYILNGNRQIDERI